MTNELASTVASNIRRYRKALKISISTLAERSELGDDFLGAVERGKKTLSLGTLANVASGLGVRPEDLVRRRGETEPRGSTSRQLQRFLLGLSESQKADTLALLIRLRSPKRVRALLIALGG